VKNHNYLFRASKNRGLQVFDREAQIFDSETQIRGTESAVCSLYLYRVDTSWKEM